jgi:hypothetical protein
MASTTPETSPAKNLRRIIVAASGGTLIEWYDFFIFGSLATVIAGQLFPHASPVTALLSTLALFAAGFVARPFGPLVFGRRGDPTGVKEDHIGGKYTFPIIMGGSTFLIGLVPDYQSIGVAAPLIVLLLRLLQGLALGGDYGNAAAYVAEHAPGNRRGFFTSWLQSIPAVALFISLVVILLVRHGLDADTTRSIGKFNDWGWRIPFLLAIILVAITVYSRWKAREYPLFVNPPKESIGKKDNLKIILVALFGAAIGQGVIFYTGGFYAQYFLENTCQLDFDQAKTMLLLAIVAAIPFFVIFGSLSDRIGRKWIMIAGMLLAVVTYPFLFRQLMTIPSTKGRAELSTQKEIISTVTFIEHTKDLIRTESARSHYEGNLVVTVTIEDTVYAGGKQAIPVLKTTRAVGGGDYWKMVGILFLMIFFVTMVSSPMAAHTGSGIIGGMTPFFAVLLTMTNSSNQLAGIWFPVVVISISLVIVAIFLPSKPAPGNH